MSHYTGAVPDTRRTTDWRDVGACLGAAQCLAWALDTRQDAGIYGGHTEDERWNLLREQAKGARRTRRATRNPRGPLQPPPGSLRELLDRHTSSQPGGHLLWTGGKCPEFQQRQFTPNQLAFLVDRGHEPDGVVHRLCEVRGCVQPLHLADTQERRQLTAAVRGAV
ncbi:WhiB family transcriptional regulator [Streptomyces ipomoeae]|uniref:WhiB family transcriptional regulator n=1 Tax=Streptomyces ipomoeae TaxID=103232 RepID=UPI0029AFA70A|nr:WhiB family transcriptional regulator [Streptomyces ipomoeae]MDX2841464.1 WhiB family transcriptional regulator [Streptomyces ipomoeae]